MSVKPHVMTSGLPGSERWIVMVVGEAYSCVSPNEQGVIIGGGAGMWHYSHGQWAEAIKAWMADLDLIGEIERAEEATFHKGWFYYHLSLAHARLGADPCHQDQAEGFWMLAQQADREYWKDQAAIMPASEVPLVG